MPVVKYPEENLFMIKFRIKSRAPIKCLKNGFELEYKM